MVDELQISLAYQGGGARVIELMAAAEACKAAEANGRFSVIRASGASAGAIAAAMHITNCNIQEIINKYNDLKLDVSRYFPSNRTKAMHAIPRLIMGKPLYDEKDVRELIRRMFESLIRN